MPPKPESVKPVLIMGAGTVGNRTADVLLSLGFRVKLVKYDARTGADGHYEIKTAELRDVYRRHPDAVVEMYAARGSNLPDRVKRLNDAGLNCVGSADDIDFANISLVIDASNGMERRNLQEIYLPQDVPFAMNGGCDPALVNQRYWASFPGNPADLHLGDYVKHPSMIVSCNTHCLTTALSVLRDSLTAELLPERVRDISITFCRRHEDPHKGKMKPEFTSVAVRDYHLDEIISLVPEVDGLVNSVVSKWPIEYFHTLIIDLDFHGPVSEHTVNRFQRALEAYPRCIVVNDELNHMKTIAAGLWAEIPDGDLPFPVFLIKQVSKYKIKLLALTPQRGIVAPSTVDYVLCRTGQCFSWKEAFDYTNQHATYRGHSFAHIKNSMQYNLEPRNYTRLLETRGLLKRELPQAAPPPILAEQ